MSAAPRKLPMPPATTTMNALKATSWPSVAYTAVTGAQHRACSAERPTLAMNATRYTRGRGTPSAAAMVELSAAARSQMPNFADLKNRYPP